MSEDQHIDQYFKDNLVPVKGRYDPSNWEEAEQMLHDHEKKRYFLYKYRFSLSSILVLLLGSMAFYLASPFENKSSNNQAETVSINRTDRETQNM